LATIHLGSLQFLSPAGTLLLACQVSGYQYETLLLLTLQTLSHIALLALTVNIVLDQRPRIRVEYHGNTIANLDMLEVNALGSIGGSAILNLVDLAARNTQLNKLWVGL